MSEDKAIILQAQNVHAWYGSSHVLQGVNLEIRKGQTVGLLGRNGMGKSTLIRTLLGHVAKRDGRINFLGHDISNSKPHLVARLGAAYVPEGRGIFSNLSVRENLIMAARLGQEAQDEWTLERVLSIFPRLGERLNNMGNQLSGGEQQMLSIGRALMTHPELIILDEATEGLAPLIVDEVWSVIETIKKSGLSVLIVDRDWHKVLKRSDKALVLQKGLVVLEGDSKAMLLNPQLHNFLGV
jgi:branched-chain amino acid transport system ATP-binding protein